MENIRYQKEKFLKYTPLHILSYSEYTSLCGTRCKAYTNTYINGMCQRTERSVVSTRHCTHFTRTRRHHAEQDAMLIRHHAEQDVMLIGHHAEQDVMLIRHHAEQDVMLIHHHTEQDVMLIRHPAERDTLLIRHYADTAV